MTRHGHSLRSLELEYCRFSPDDVLDLAHYADPSCPLRELTLKGCGGIHHSTLLAILRGHLKLTMLGLSCLREIDEVVMVRIGKLKLLNSLSLNTPALLDDRPLLTTISLLPNLHTLKLNKIRLPHLQDMEGGPLSLKVLHLNECNLVDEDILFALRRWPALIRFSLNNNPRVSS